MRACEKGNKTPNGLTWINAQTLAKSHVHIPVYPVYPVYNCLPTIYQQLG